MAFLAQKNAWDRFLTTLLSKIVPFVAKYRNKNISQNSSKILTNASTTIMPDSL